MEPGAGGKTAPPEKADPTLVASPGAADHVACPRCNESISAEEQNEHADWHFAMDLQAQAQERDPSSNMAPPGLDPHRAATTTKISPPIPVAPISADQFFCSRCQKALPKREQAEHNDWHVAQDLQQQESGDAVPSAYFAVADSKPSTKKDPSGNAVDSPPGYAPLSHSAGAGGSARSARVPQHTNQVIQAATIRARDEQQMQNVLQNLQFQYRIYNSEIEPEHEADYYCNCAVHQYQRMKWNRYEVQKLWSRAVMYPGEKHYDDNTYTPTVFSQNPYRYSIVSPFGYGFNRGGWYGIPRPQPSYHARFVHQTIRMNNKLNAEAQAKVNGKEPRVDIWHEDVLGDAMSRLSVAGTKDAKIGSQDSEKTSNVASPTKGELRDEKHALGGPAASSANDKSQSEASNVKAPAKSSKLASFRRSIGLHSTEEKAVKKAGKMANHGHELRNAILAEENGRWPDHQWRYLVSVYQDKVGMTKKIAELRSRAPIQYLHLLRAGYFEPIPVAWATSMSNPLKFKIEAAAGWRGITPAWRGYEDTAEERLYWVLNHREGSEGGRLKPDFISALDMARARMARAVEPPPEYYSESDTCHTQHTSSGYSKQVPPPPFVAYDRPELPTDDTMILLDVSGSMDFDPLRPNYNEYLITGFSKSTQPKNKDVAKAIIRRFTDAMSNHDHSGHGYDLTIFSNEAHYVGAVNHKNLNSVWQHIRIGGGTRVMTGWQKVKELHFQKHSQSATHHPVYGWQAGPETPMLRLLLLLDGEATDMDEFELDLLGLSWAHVTIFLIGVDGCPHHHRHANELQRISDVNHHVSFVDAQGNLPERYVTHELLKRHLGYDVQLQEFRQLEELPAYSEY